MPEEALGGVLVALASVQFGLVVLLGKVASNRGVPVESLLAIRFCVAAVVLAVGLIATRTALAAAPGERAKLLALGAFGYGVEATLFFLALARGTASAVTLLFFVYPVIVTVLSAFVGVGMPGRLVMGSLGAAVAGVALVVGASGRFDITGAGIAFALGSACMYTLYLLGVERTLKRTSSVVASMCARAGRGSSTRPYGCGSAASRRSERRPGSRAPRPTRSRARASRPDTG